MNSIEVADLVPSQVVGMERAHNVRGIEKRVARLVSLDLAGFVIRTAHGFNRNVDDSVVTEVADQIVDSYERQLAKPIEGPAVYRFDRESQLDDKGWHMDRATTDEKPGITIHATFEGKGTVELAHGPRHEAKAPLRLSSTLDEHYSQFGMIDPAVMDPLIFRLSDLRPGDIVVFKDSDARPTWHRFTTTEGRRYSEAHVYFPAAPPHLEG